MSRSLLLVVVAAFAFLALLVYVAGLADDAARSGVDSAWKEKPYLRWPTSRELPFDRRLVLRNGEFGSLSDLQLTGAGDRVLVAASQGAFELDLSTGSLIAGSEVRFQGEPGGAVFIVDADGEGPPEFFLTRSAGWMNGSALHGRKGRRRWSSDLFLLGERPFDLDHDGRAEFLLAHDESSTVRLVDHLGRTRWEQSWFPRGEKALAMDVDGDGVDEILCLRSQRLVVCDAEGVELFSNAPPGPCRVMTLERVDNTDGLGGASLLVGARVDVGETRSFWHYAYERDARTLLGRYRGPVAIPCTGAQRVERESGDLWIRTLNFMVQAFPAGYEDSTFRVAILDQQGRGVRVELFETPEGIHTGVEGSVLVLRAEPLRLLVAYGDSVWELAEGEE